MTLILIIAGTIAALLLFRWARTLVLLAIAAAAIYWVMVSAHAQEPMVACHLGSSTEAMPAGACAMLKNAFAKLRFEGGDRGRLSMWECAEAITQRVHPEYQPTPGLVGMGLPNEFLPLCTEMWQIEIYARAARR